MRAAALALVALAPVWPAWWLAGLALNLLGLGVLDPFARLPVIFLVLTLAEAGFARAAPH